MEPSACPDSSIPTPQLRSPPLPRISTLCHRAQTIQLHTRPGKPRYRFGKKAKSVLEERHEKSMSLRLCYPDCSCLLNHLRFQIVVSRGDPVVAGFLSEGKAIIRWIENAMAEGQHRRIRNTKVIQNTRLNIDVLYDSLAIDLRQGSPEIKNTIGTR